MTGHRARMLAGEPYLPGDPELAADRRHARVLCEQFAATSPSDAASAEALLRELVHELGADTEVLSPLHCDYGYQISIGARTFINVGAVILDSATVRIGADVQIGPYVQLVTPTHPLDPDHRRAGWEASAPIVIADDVWLAAGVVVCGGVSIGGGAVIGAGSVVTHDMPARHLCLGSPCRPVREITAADAVRPPWDRV